MKTGFLVLGLLVVGACATQSGIRRVQEFRAAKERGDIATAKSFIAPDARQYFEEVTGPGEPYTIAGGGRWDHWDHYFHSRTTMSNWRQNGNAVTADVVETNDFMQMLDWTSPPYTITWWLDPSGRIERVLVKGSPEKSVSRLDEFKTWAREHHPDELAYLMPNGKLDPTGDRAERWRAILAEWRAKRQ